MNIDCIADMKDKTFLREVRHRDHTLERDPCASEEED